MAGHYITSLNVRRKSEGLERRFLRGIRKNMGTKKEEIFTNGENVM